MLGPNQASLLKEVLFMLPSKSLFWGNFTLLNFKISFYHKEVNTVCLQLVVESLILEEKIKGRQVFEVFWLKG